MTDKATPSPASADSVMAKAMMLVGALDDSCEEATSLPFLEAVTALRAEVERLAAQAAPTEPPQEFESAQGRALASAWAEGWAQCRDAEFIGEDAQDEAFNQSVTLAQCLHADQTRFQGGLSNDQLRRAWSAKLPNVIPTDEQLTAFALGIEAAAQPSAQAERAPVVQAVQAVQATSERTPQDYAIEHAEYMAVDGEHLIAAINDFSKALQEVDDGAANPSDVDAARETLTEALGAMQSGIYEFRKRRDRASSGATTADVRMLTDAKQTAIIDMHNTGRAQGDHECVEDIQRKFCAVNAGKRIPADGVIGGV